MKASDSNTTTSNNLTDKHIEYIVSYTIHQNNRKLSYTRPFSVYSEALNCVDDLIENEEVQRITLEEKIRQRLERWQRSIEFDGEMVEV